MVAIGGGGALEGGGWAEIVAEGFDGEDGLHDWGGTEAVAGDGFGGDEWWWGGEGGAEGGGFCGVVGGGAGAVGEDEADGGGGEVGGAEGGVDGALEPIAFGVDGGHAFWGGEERPAAECGERGSAAAGGGAEGFEDEHGGTGAGDEPVAVWEERAAGGVGEDPGGGERGGDERVEGVVGAAGDHGVGVAEGDLFCGCGDGEGTGGAGGGDGP